MSVKPAGDLSGFFPEDSDPQTPNSSEKPELDYYKQMTDSERQSRREDLKIYGQAVEGETFEVYFSDFFLTLEREEADLKDELPQIEAWIERSKGKYNEKMRRFEKMRVVSDREYRKHFPVPN